MQLDVIVRAYMYLVSPALTSICLVFKCCVLQVLSLALCVKGVKGGICIPAVPHPWLMNCIDGPVALGLVCIFLNDEIVCPSVWLHVCICYRRTVSFLNCYSECLVYLCQYRYARKQTHFHFLISGLANTLEPMYTMLIYQGIILLLWGLLQCTAA